MYLFTTGDKSGINKPLPYKYISQLGIAIHGLPDGIVFKHPSSYGLRQMISIYDVRSRLTLTSKLYFSIMFIDALA